ncbi:MAG: (2Fe-2S)-binding protein [Thermomicrobiales bacterium]|nr:(2Fe-2S)-binding protein [Thermomicrobiales bacterium]MCA9880297.1 (2Fe-2S)-binding protein [Thermomicrobiales bacterium]
MTDRTLICRCEEVAAAEVAAALQHGAVTVDDVKRRTRAGMGACQGIFCIPAVAAIVAEGTGTPIGELAPMTARPPVRPIPLAALAALRQDASE